MDIKLFIKSLSEYEHEQLLNYVARHHRFEKVVWQVAKNYNDIYVFDWVYLVDMSTRLKNGLLSLYNPSRPSGNDLAFTKLSEVKHEHFEKSRSLGEKSWIEFIELRGY